MAEAQLTNQDASAPATTEGKYVYCVIQTQEERDFGPIGIGQSAENAELRRRLDAFG